MVIFGKHLHRIATPTFVPIFPLRSLKLVKVLLYFCRLFPTCSSGVVQALQINFQDPVGHRKIWVFPRRKEIQRSSLLRFLPFTLLSAVVHFEDRFERAMSIAQCCRRLSERKFNSERIKHGKSQTDHMSTPNTHTS